MYIFFLTKGKKYLYPIHISYSNNHTQFLKCVPYPVSQLCSLRELQFGQERAAAAQQQQGMVTAWAAYGKKTNG